MELMRPQPTTPEGIDLDDLIEALAPGMAILVKITPTAETPEEEDAENESEFDMSVDEDILSIFGGSVSGGGSTDIGALLLE